jgi:hypothetical protein
VWHAGKHPVATCLEMRRPVSVFFSWRSTTGRGKFVGYCRETAHAWKESDSEVEM